MTVHSLMVLMAWCIGINYGILVIWFGAFWLAHDWLYRLHARWFKLSTETFDALHYAAMAAYKLGIMLFFLVPFVALYVTRH